jgi:hypothetical protein
MQFCTANPAQSALPRISHKSSDSRVLLEYAPDIFLVLLWIAKLPQLAVEIALYLEEQEERKKRRRIRNANPGLLHVGR